MRFRWARPIICYAVEEAHRNMKSPSPAADARRSAPAHQFEHVDAGIYRYTPNGNYYARTGVNGKRTWRSLKTKNLKFARERLYELRVEIGRRLRKFGLAGGGDPGFGGF